MTWVKGLTYSARTQDVAWLVAQFRALGATRVDVEMFDDGQSSHRAVVDFTESTESGAHAPDLPATETELAVQITYRSTGRGAYDVVQSRAEGPAVVLAMVQFSEGVRGRVHALERFIDSLRKTSQDVQP